MSLNYSRHRPILCCLHFPVLNCGISDSESQTKRINWDKVTDDHIRNYQLKLAANGKLAELIKNIPNKQTVDNVHSVVKCSVFVMKCSLLLW